MSYTLRKILLNYSLYLMYSAREIMNTQYKVFVANFIAGNDRPHSISVLKICFLFYKITTL